MTGQFPEFAAYAKVTDGNLDEKDFVDMEYDEHQELGFDDESAFQRIHDDEDEWMSWQQGLREARVAAVAAKRRAKKEGKSLEVPREQTSTECQAAIPQENRQDKLTSAAHRVYGTTELLEKVLLQLLTKDLLLAQKVNRRFKAVIDACPGIQRALFFKPGRAPKDGKHLTEPFANPLFASKYFPNTSVLVVHSHPKQVTFLRAVYTHEFENAKDKDRKKERRAVLSLRTVRCDELACKTSRLIKKLHVNGSWRRMLLTQPPLETWTMLNGRHLTVRTRVDVNTYPMLHLEALYAPQVAVPGLKLGEMLPAQWKNVVQWLPASSYEEAYEEWDEAHESDRAPPVDYHAKVDPRPAEEGGTGAAIAPQQIGIWWQDDVQTVRVIELNVQHRLSRSERLYKPLNLMIKRSRRSGEWRRW